MHCSFARSLDARSLDAPCLGQLAREQLAREHRGHSFLHRGDAVVFRVAGQHVEEGRGADRLLRQQRALDITEPAGAVLFLASDESKFITAHEIAPDAGVTEF